MRNLVTLSVVVPTFNDAQHLPECISSIKNQSLPVDEIIVINDGTTDKNCLRVLNDMRDSDDLVRVVDQKNAGPAAARNTGLAVARGDLIAFVDADDRLRRDCFRKRYDLMKNDPAILGAYGGYESVSPDRVPKFSSFQELGSHQPKARHIGIPGRVPGGLPLYLFRVEPLRAAGGLDESLSLMEDFDLIIRLAGRGGRFAGTNEPTYIRSVRADSHSRASARVRLKGTLAFLAKARREKYFGFTEQVWRHLVAILDYCRALSRRIFK